jgi:RNA binding exosome subunit
LSKEHSIKSIQISTIAHATDDLDKVQLALNAILPDSMRQRQLFTRRYLEGHHRNPIVLFDARLTKSAETDELTTYLMTHIPSTERLIIERDLGLHSDGEGNLYLRIDKQRAFRGSIALGIEDPIRIRIKFSRLSGNPKKLMTQLLVSGRVA